MDPIEDCQENVDRTRFISIRSVSMTLALALAVVCAGFLAYGLFQLYSGGDENGSAVGLTTSDQQAAQNLQFSFLRNFVKAPEIRFIDGDNRALTLRNFGGRPVLLNVWATWCVPCRKEMPSLDRLQAKFDPSRFLVLPLSIDAQGVAAVARFYHQLKIKSLRIYVDQSGAALNLLRAPGVPTSIFLDKDGREIGRKIGPAAWDKPETIALLRKHMNFSFNVENTGAPK